MHRTCRHLSTTMTEFVSVNPSRQQIRTPKRISDHEYSQFQKSKFNKASDCPRLFVLAKHTTWNLCRSFKSTWIAKDIRLKGTTPAKKTHSEKNSAEPSAVRRSGAPHFPHFGRHICIHTSLSHNCSQISSIYTYQSEQTQKNTLNTNSGISSAR